MLGLLQGSGPDPGPGADQAPDPNSVFLGAREAAPNRLV